MQYLTKHPIVNFASGKDYEGTYRMYKNEFSEHFVNHLKSKWCAFWCDIVEETEKVLTIKTWASNIDYAILPEMFVEYNAEDFPKDEEWID